MRGYLFVYGITHMAAWDKREDESSRAYSAFIIYRDMGPQRSLRKTADIYYEPGSLNVRVIQKWSSKYDWVKRATAFDEAKRKTFEETIAADFEAERTQERARRQAIVNSLRNMLAKIMQEQISRDNLSPSEFNALTNAAKTVLQESRAEYNDLPAQRQELSGPAGGAIEVKGYTTWSPDVWDDDE